ncbi:hypothetical protein L1S35_06520 [Flavobacterium sp. AS60]|uniref:hypothetical protein n=1 Tax=Flavobacterium anseongense TaxID=2910677 RepID=UPI001F21D4D0|nr:hypothetical protein [Flavobacterium sp. AS60]MCF6129320.1 hypothetical protein [Flavobacterium sp. AS60]
MEEILGYGFFSDDEGPVENKDTSINKNNKSDNINISSVSHSEEETDKILLYDHNKTFIENFEDGIDVKYVIVPIYKEGNKDENFTPLLNAGAKVIMNRKKIMDDYSEGLNYFVLDYDSIFGLRLLSFQRYNSKTFKCDERAFFETLIIKFRRFNYQKFYYSYPEILKELGINIDRAHTIVKKFIKMGFLRSELITSVIDGRPSQITYYWLNASKIIELIPTIFKQPFHENVKEGISEYLKEALPGDDDNPKNISDIMQ